MFREVMEPLGAGGLEKEVHHEGHILRDCSLGQLPVYTPLLFVFENGIAQIPAQTAHCHSSFIIMNFFLGTIGLNKSFHNFHFIMVFIRATQSQLEQRPEEITILIISTDLSKYGITVFC